MQQFHQIPPNTTPTPSPRSTSSSIPTPTPRPPSTNAAGNRSGEGKPFTGRIVLEARRSNNLPSHAERLGAKRPAHQNPARHPASACTRAQLRAGPRPESSTPTKQTTRTSDSPIADARRPPPHRPTRQPAKKTSSQPNPRQEVHYEAKPLSQHTAVRPTDRAKLCRRWKKTEDAGRVFTVDTTGETAMVVTGLPWRAEVCQQVFEEAAVDCGRALGAWSDSRSGKRKGQRVGFPSSRRKPAWWRRFGCATSTPRGAHRRSGLATTIGRVRSPCPVSGRSAVFDDTRRLRRMRAKDRAKILFATVTHHADRWWVALNVEAADLHPPTTHPMRDPADDGGWVGVDRGLSAFLVAAHADGPKSPESRMRQSARGRDETATTAGEIVVAQAERIP